MANGNLRERAEKWVGASDGTRLYKRAMDWVGWTYEERAARIERIKRKVERWTGHE